MPSTEKLSQFVAWVQQHIKGDEKGESQIFLDRLFQAFGHGGVKEAGATLEMRVPKNDENGVAFADLVWKPVVLVEMKKRGVNLQPHYRQAFDYWTRLVPNRPRYVVLCNFDEFRVYDFETQIDTPKDTVALTELPKNYGALRFLEPGSPKPTFGNDHVVVTGQAADALANCFNKILKRGVERPLVQRFILQTLVSLFAEDIGLLPKYLVVQLLEDCHSPSDTHDIIGGLFEAMNTKQTATGGRFKGVAYFNGGLFAQPARVELADTELVLLREAAKFNWSQVRPEIFGTLFQHSLGTEERRAFGAHFTHPADIMKIVGPTIVEPWREQIESARTLKRLRELLHRLHRFRVLDPAGGSCNFLYISYRELKRLEARLYQRMAEFASEAEPGQMRLSFLSVKNFFALDINPLAIEIGKVTMMIARKLAIDELHITEPALPLDNLDDNFICCDALLDAHSNPTQWPEADVLVGNPPFTGAKFLKPQRGPDYVNAVRRAYPDVPGMADYCVYWFRKAHDHLPPCTAADPVAGRAGLVGTQNVRNNQSRVGGLDYICKTGTVIEAVENQPWSGEANVHVSIVNWAKTQDAVLLPKNRRLWFKVEPDPAMKKLRQRGTGSAAKEYELDFRECDYINSALSDRADVGSARALPCNEKPKRVFQGVTPGHDGFVLNEREKCEIEKDGKSASVVRAYLTGREIVTGDGTPERFIIDFQRRSILDVQSYPSAFAHVQRHVLPDIERKAHEEHATETVRKAHVEKWWMLWRDRREMFEGFTQLSGRFVACSRVTKRPIFVFMNTQVWPSDKVQAFLFDDDYSFGILQSAAHWQWFLTKCSKLTERLSYSIESVFDTFPWPQSPTAKQIEAVAATGRGVRHVRDEALKSVKGGLRTLYRTLQLPGKNPLKDAHAALDAAVLDAYGFSAKKDLLAQLLALNLDVAHRIEQGQPVTAPGVPKNYPDAKKLVTEDCIRPTEIS
ncbi:MAG: class I SAM-dependent DNA methyltransferase [Verrucomicrobiae bacterium]|nr:class I SAM-dependent DNA methyltransferase [Verrucomicrobiae bacterium]